MDKLMERAWDVREKMQRTRSLHPNDLWARVMAEGEEVIRDLLSGLDAADTQAREREDALWGLRETFRQTWLGEGGSQTAFDMIPEVAAVEKVTTRRVG